MMENEFGAGGRTFDAFDLDAVECLEAERSDRAVSTVKVTVYL